MASNSLGRRFLKTRQYSWVQTLAKWVAGFNITPNQISMLSLLSAIFASLCFVTMSISLKWILAILFIQFRLFCNMMDGLVAIECNKKSVLGDIYNDLPDRIADIFILIAFSYSINSLGSIAHDMGYIAAILAVFTAYIRLLFTSIGAPSNYCGPMAKQHRMFTICLACVLIYFSGLNNIVIYTLILLNLGMIVTIYSRIKSGVIYLS